MKITELAKTLSLMDFIVLFLLEKDFTNDEVATMTELTRQTLHNITKRHEKLLEALKMIQSEPQEFGNQDINLIVNAFKETFDTTNVTKFDRWAAKRLAEKHGAPQIVRIIQALGQVSGDKYSPSVNSVRQIEEKWVTIASYFKKKIGESVTVEI